MDKDHPVIFETASKYCILEYFLTFQSPLECKEIKPVNPEGNQSWIFIGRTDAEAEAPIFWPSDAKNWLIQKVPDAGKDWGREQKGMTEDEMVGWQYHLSGHEFEQAPGKPGMLHSTGSQRVGHDWETAFVLKLKHCSSWSQAYHLLNWNLHHQLSWLSGLGTWTKTTRQHFWFSSSPTVDFGTLSSIITWDNFL